MDSSPPSSLAPTWMMLIGKHVQSCGSSLLKILPPTNSQGYRIQRW